MSGALLWFFPHRGRVEKTLSVALFIFFCCTCGHTSLRERVCADFANVVDVSSKLNSISTEPVFLGQYVDLCPLDEYLLIEDALSSDLTIHLFDKKNFKYITSTGRRGRGPGEIGRFGYLAADETNRRFFVTDYAKLLVHGFDVDSLVRNPEHYAPYVMTRVTDSRMPLEYRYVNDTLCYAEVGETVGNNNYMPVVARWNMKTGEIKAFGYEHPMVGIKRAGDAFSIEKNLYVEAHRSRDLISICTLDGELKCNIYGPGWDGGKVGANSYYGDIVLCDSTFMVGYLGERGLVRETNGMEREKCASKILIFGYDGTYIKTLEVGKEITSMAYDEEDNRLYMSLIDPDMQLAYVDLDGLL